MHTNICWFVNIKLTMSNTLTTEEQLQKMIAIINQFPNGMVEMDDNGTIVQMNAKGVQLLMPLFMQFQLSGTSMYEVFKVIDPEIVKRIIAFTDSFGTIMNLENFKISLSVANTNIDRYFYFTILKISETAISVVFDDITEVYEKENRIRDAIQEKAVEKSKFEMASGILHDIGNAVVGFGSYINRIKRHLAHSDYDNLKALQGFLEKNRHHFEPGIGNAKTNALLEMVAGIADNHQKNTQAANEIIAEQMSIIAHVSEILTIQRQYVKGQQTTEREKVNLRNIINDSISMILPNLAKSDISVQTDLPTDLTLVSGDKTKLIQVFLNILKNAAESIVAFDLSDKKIIINAKEKTDIIEIEVIDTGAGIDEATALNLFERGFTSKESGTGLGLYNCRSIVETHQGTFTLSSAGVGKGALALLTFKKD